MKSLLACDKFDGFTMLRSVSENFDAQVTREFLLALNDLAAQGEKLIYIDMGPAVNLTPENSEALAAGVELLKRSQAVEFVLVCEPGLVPSIQAGPLKNLLQLFERRDDRARRVATLAVLESNILATQQRLDATIEGAITAGVQRWIGKAPASIEQTSAMVNPAEDIVSAVIMNIDGCEFQLFLSASRLTLQKMVTQILRQDIAYEDPAVFDAACELLNYLTAYFRQHLTNEDGAIELTAPRLLHAEDMMVLLDLNISAHKVQTHHGPFDVWIEAA